MYAIRSYYEILPGKTPLEAMNTDLVCDAINTAMRELFLQIAYGRSQSAFSEGGLPIGAGLEDLGKGLRSQVGTTYGTKAKGVRYLDLAEGYIMELGLDSDNEVIGYKFVHLGKMMDAIKAGKSHNRITSYNVCYTKLLRLSEKYIHHPSSRRSCMIFFLLFRGFFLCCCLLIL